MLPFGVTLPATVPQGSEIPEGLMNNRVLSEENIWTIGWTAFLQKSFQVSVSNCVRSTHFKPRRATEIENMIHGYVYQSH
jgi:hypothetical protein